MNADDIYDTELSPAESARVARLSQAELALIDAALLSQVSDDWRKVARVVGMAMLSMPDRLGEVPDIFFAKRVGRLVESGQLESQGDLRRMRFSEVRRRSA
jgi:multidrug efflux pump subunit AcrA (membrane-fusion protein)